MAIHVRKSDLDKNSDGVNKSQYSSQLKNSFGLFYLFNIYIFITVTDFFVVLEIHLNKFKHLQILIEFLLGEKIDSDSTTTNPSYIK